MKTTIALLLLLFFVGAAPAQNDHQPPPAGRPAHGPDEPVTFLGVEAGNVSPVVADQLNLTPGFGLVVNSVMPESPAATAGIKSSDILKLLNDQILVDPNQLAALVRSFKEGDEVSLTLLRKGQETKVTVKLGRRHLPRPPLLRDHLIPATPFGRRIPGGPLINKLPGNAEDQAREAHERALREHQKILRDRKEQPPGVEGKEHSSSQSSHAVASVTVPGADGRTTMVELDKVKLVFKDENGEVMVTTTNGDEMLTARDKNGEVRFSGPINTDAEREAVPAQLKRYLKVIDKQKHALPVAPVPPPPPAPPSPNEPAGGPVI